MTGAPDRGHEGLLVAGWVMLLLFPLGTVVTGFVIIERRTINGVLMCFLGTVACLAYFWLGASLLA